MMFLNEITRLYGEFKEDEHARIVDNADFGFRRIIVERPLRLNFVVDKERISRLEQTSAFTKLARTRKRKDAKAAEKEIAEGHKLQKAILSALDDIAGKGVVKNREGFAEMLKGAFNKANLKISASLFKAILTALAERDETVDVCTDSKGNREPDPELRDYENVPLKEDVEKYMKREVRPQVPDVWVDESKTKIGYEINFNRYFHKYTPPRPLPKIEANLKRIEKEIAEMVDEVTT